MKKWIFISSLLLLSGCSLNPDAAKQYKMEQKLEADIMIADGHIQVETSPEAEVSLSFWKEGGEQEQLNIRQIEKGIYQAEKTIPKEGIYFVKADIQTETQHIMPAKKVWAGQPADSLPKEPKIDTKSHH
ncbi:hypothetical protein [Domibacillus indicus]|uniref:hypothetical protein n=1 Tax=Domibacillus indicus TaxID=1437523 RepID=UPI0006182C2B|nr:hypothetical protein [Domibacillus indicus]